MSAKLIRGRTAVSTTYQFNLNRIPASQWSKESPDNCTEGIN